MLGCCAHMRIIAPLHMGQKGFGSYKYGKILTQLMWNVIGIPLKVIFSKNLIENLISLNAFLEKG